MNSDNIETIPAVFYIPSNTIALKLCAKIYKDGEIKEAETSFELPDIIEAIIDGDYWAGENIKYVLTDKGKELVKGEG